MGRRGPHARSCAGNGATAAARAGAGARGGGGVECATQAPSNKHHAAVAAELSSELMGAHIL